MPSLSPSPLSTPPSLSPRTLLLTAITTNSLPLLHHSINLLSQSRRGFDSAWALSSAIKHAQPDIVRYLLDEAGATVEGLGPWKVAAAAVWEWDGEGEDGLERVERVEETEEERRGRERLERVERTWEVLVERGWDVNIREANDAALARNTSLLSLVCHISSHVHWLLAHNASVLDPPTLDPFVTPPLLECVAAKSSLATFRLLRDRGAVLGRRSLHRAAESAAGARTERERTERMEVVKWLVEEEGVDVNGMDVGEGETLPNYWGTPAAYAVQVNEGDRGEEIVGWLLEKGANPRIKDCYGNLDVFSLAERSRNKVVLDMLIEWEARRKSRNKESKREVREGGGEEGSGNERERNQE